MFKIYSLVFISVGFVSSLICMEGNTPQKSPRELSNGTFKILSNPSAHPFIFSVSREKAKYFYDKANNQILRDFEHRELINSNDSKRD